MASTGVDDGHGRNDALPSLTVSVRPSTAAKASSLGDVAGGLRRNAYAVTRKALQDLEVAKASAEAKVAELVKENKLLDVQWMAAEARAAAAEARDAGVSRGERSAPDTGYSNAASEPVSKSMVEARLLTMLVSWRMQTLQSSTRIFSSRFRRRPSSS